MMASTMPKGMETVQSDLMMAMHRNFIIHLGISLG